jgi:hypothetical protein
VGLLLDAGLHFADDTDSEAPVTAARDIDAAPLVTAGGRWASTRAGSRDAARAASASGLVMLCHSLMFNRRIQEAESQLTKQPMYSGIVKE